MFCSACGYADLPSVEIDIKSTLLFKIFISLRMLDAVFCISSYLNFEHDI